MSGPGTIWRAVRRLAPMAVLAAAVSGVNPTPGSSWEVDARRFLDAADRAPRVPVPSAETITEIERASVEIAARVDQLRSAQKMYAAQQAQRKRIEGMDRELAQAIEAAERHSRIQEQIGAWAMFFQIVSDVYTVVETAMEADAGTPESQRGEEVGAEGEMQSSDRRPASPDRHEDGLQGSGGEHNGIVIVCGDGKCEAFRASDLVDAALNPLSSTGSARIRELDGKIRDTADELPPLGCWLEDETCFPFSGPPEQISTEIYGTTYGKQEEFQTKANPLISKKAKSLFSFLLDFAGPVGKGKGISEALGGKDPVTGEPFTVLERIIIGASSAYGGGPGKKGAKKLLKLGAKSGKQVKWINRYINKYPKDMTIDKIIGKYKKASIRRAPLEKGTLPLGKIGNLTWAEFLSKAADKKKFPLYYKSKDTLMKLLTNKDYNRL